MNNTIALLGRIQLRIAHKMFSNSLNSTFPIKIIDNLSMINVRLKISKFSTSILMVQRSMHLDAERERRGRATRAHHSLNHKIDDERRRKLNEKSSAE